MTVRDLTNRADSREIAEWVAYFDMHDRESPEVVRHAQLMYHMTHLAHVKGKGSYPRKPKFEDFMPRVRQVAQTSEEQRDLLKSLLGGK